VRKLSQSSVSGSTAMCGAVVAFFLAVTLGSAQE
jgi:hypothetical protein